MKQITISASFKDCINTIIFYNFVDLNKTKEVEVESFWKKEDVISLFQNCISWRISGDMIIFRVNLSEEEIQKQINHDKSAVRIGLNKLRYWCNQKEEWKNQIFEYLQHNRLDWILRELKPD